MPGTLGLCGHCRQTHRNKRTRSATRIPGHVIGPPCIHICWSGAPRRDCRNVEGVCCGNKWTSQINCLAVSVHLGTHREVPWDSEALCATKSAHRKCAAHLEEHGFWPRYLHATSLSRRVTCRRQQCAMLNVIALNISPKAARCTDGEQPTGRGADRELRSPSRCIVLDYGCFWMAIPHRRCETPTDGATSVGEKGKRKMDPCVVRVRWQCPTPLL